ncbi:hypothetical protein GKZ68_12260 [Hymenobacter sp. BRD128]|uniref:DUF6252 family protein n=1 Tax=Hymenobacter sp. BRD128 TaxID=2675878 RepID=UPI001566FC97|nr:DUF6252 family protein [Hymenobacter sp. BRD128]QKG57324.1 hypothetical protein GKZ68_12260 [Hymenobacter sp. BRD128]
MKKLVLSLLLLAVLLGLSQCKKSDPTPPPTPSQLGLLPPATQTGQRTFGCLVNGQAWTPAGSPFGGPLFTAVYLDNRLGISASRKLLVNGTNSFQRMGFSISKIYHTGTYSLNDSSRVGSYEDFDKSCSMYTSSSQVGKVIITKLDFVNQIVSGTFAFTLEAPTCGKVIVTDGRFDTRF